MTAPDLSSLIPLKYKTWVTLVGGLLTLAVPTVLTMEAYFPWWANLAIGVVLWLLTALGVYKAPYVAPGQVLAPDTPAVQAAAQQAPPTTGHPHQNPWE